MSSGGSPKKEYYTALGARLIDVLQSDKPGWYLVSYDEIMGIIRNEMSYLYKKRKRKHGKSNKIKSIHSEGSDAEDGATVRSES